MKIARPWLVGGLEAAEREAAVMRSLGLIRYRVRRWPFRISQTWAPLRLVWLSRHLDPARVVPTLAHEYEHAIRAGGYGRWAHTFRYAAAPVAVGAALVLGGVSVAGAALDGSWPALGAIAAMVIGLLAWPWSERFRRDEEVEGFAAGAAATMASEYGDPADPYAYVTAYTLHSMAWPYLVRGDYRETRGRVARRAVSMLLEEYER